MDPVNEGGTDHETPSQPPSEETQNAIQDLIKSGGVHSSTCQPDFVNSCNEILHLHFYSEEGRLHVIDGLAKLNGNFVAKIVRRGLSGLSKVYTDRKTFEDESIQLVELCVSLYLKYDSCRDGQVVPSPALVVDCTTELCDELLKSRTGGVSTSSQILLSKCLVELIKIYETIVNAPLVVVALDDIVSVLTTCNIPNSFKTVFDALKTRITDELFEELLQQTAAIARCDQELNCGNSKKLTGQTIAKLLDKWQNLLRIPFVTNWFAVQTAKHDFLVHDEEYARRLPFASEMTYQESLICQVCCVLKVLSSGEQFELSGEKKRLQVFFDHPEIFQRHPEQCFQLLQSNVSTRCIQEVFGMLGIKLNRDLLPQMTDAHVEARDKMTKSLIAADPNSFQHLQEYLSLQIQFSTALKLHQTLAFVVDVIIQALIRLPNQEPILKILQFWKQAFRIDNEYVALLHICLLIHAVIQMEQHENLLCNMEKLVEFLCQLPKDLHSTMIVWHSILAGLMMAFPKSWNSKDKSLDKVGSQAKIQVIRVFVQSTLTHKLVQEEIKAEALKLGMDLYEDVPMALEYELALNAAVNVVPDMGIKNGKKYVLDFVNAVGGKSLDRNDYGMACSILKLIENSKCITDKTKIFQCYLHLLEKSPKNTIIGAVKVTFEFMILQVNTANVERFLDLVGRADLSTCHLILQCTSYFKDGGNDLVTFLSVFDQTLCSRENCDLFTKTTLNYLQIAGAIINAEACQYILACIAGSIVDGTFDDAVNNPSLRYTCYYLDLHKNESTVQPFDVLVLYKELTKAFRQVKLIADNREDYTTNFSSGLTEMFRLLLPFWRTISLIRSITEMLNQGRFSDKEEVLRIMFHLFKTPDDKELSIDRSGLSEHFEKLMKLSIVKKLAKMPIHGKGTVKILAGKEVFVHVGEFMTVMRLLAEKTPFAFGQGTSNGLFEFTIKWLENRNFAGFLLAMANAIIKKNATVAEFKSGIETIEEILHDIPIDLIPLIPECITECHNVGLSDEQGIRTLVLFLRDWNWQEEDLSRVNGSLNSFLNIPKQLVLAFQAAPDIEVKKHGIKRLLDVVREIGPVVLYGFSLHHDDEQVFQKLAQHYFHMLLRHTILSPKDVCTVLFVYISLNRFPIQQSPFTEASLDGDDEWSSDYDQSKALTPGKLAYLIMHHLRELHIDDNEVQGETLVIFNVLLRNNSLDCGCPLPQSNTFQEYIAVFVCIMKGSRSLDEIKQWLGLSSHHVVSCKEVIQEVCSWTSTEERGHEESLRMVKKILEVFKSFKKLIAPLCNARSNEYLYLLTKILRNIQDEEIIYSLFELLFISTRCTATCVDVIAEWNNCESFAFLTKLRGKYEGCSPVDIRKIDNELAVWFQILPFVSKAFPNSAKKVGDFLDKMIDNYELDDALRLGRIPIWFKQMTDAGFPQPIIESWCTSLVLSEKLSSSDVDAITNLTPDTIQLITKESGEIERCLFSTVAPKTWKDDESHSTAPKESIEFFKRCLQFAKILNEFASIATQLKENSEILERVKDGTHGLCSAFSENPTSSGGLFKIRYNVLKELFVVLFSGEVGVTEESILKLTSHAILPKLVIVFRRLARSVHSKPILFGHVKSVVDKALQRLLTNPEEDFQAVQNAIHKQITELESNQDAMHTLQTAGYNQGLLHEDLWDSSSIHMSSYVPKVESIEAFRIQRLLKQMWREWRSILDDLNIKEVKVKGKNVKTTELMNHSDSLEIMGSQLEAVKKATQNAPPNRWSSHRRRQLMQKERNVRNTITEEAKQEKVERGKRRPKLTKMVIIWANQLLESVKKCTEKIPGCYAPNGFHSEKPVICGLSADNKILTLYKQEKGNTLTELEDVEVKLFPVGMLVFGVFSSSHSYDTDQLWAAFFKMLLVKRLVPKIFITNVSPGFEWIKTFVQPELSTPRGVTFCQCNSLIPTREDSFDYEPNLAIHGLGTTTANTQMQELIILTPENVIPVEFPNLQSPNRDKVIREWMDRVRQSIQNDSRLHEVHPESQDKILKRLVFAIRKAVEISVDGHELTEETISSFIDMKKQLSSGCVDSLKVQSNGEAFYCRLILDALQTEIAGNREWNTAFECCEHVEFLKLDSTATERNE